MSLSDEELEAVAAAAQEGDMDAALTLGRIRPSSAHLLGKSFC